MEVGGGGDDSCEFHLLEEITFRFKPAGKVEAA